MQLQLKEKQIKRREILVAEFIGIGKLLAVAKGSPKSVVFIF